jgi:hypothetical protein
MAVVLQKHDDGGHVVSGIRELPGTILFATY